MNPLHPTPNLHACVKYRETHGQRGFKPLLQAAVDARIKQHLAEDRFFAYQLNVGRLAATTTKGNRLAYAQGDRVTLYDLFSRRIMWSCEVPIRAGYNIFALSIFDKEKVRVFTEISNVRAIKTDVDIAILNSTGIIASATLQQQMVSRYSNPYRMHKMHLFNLESTSLRCDDLETGGVVAVDLERFHRNQYATIDVNDQFYVVTTASKPVEKIPSQVFIFDRLTQQKKILNLEPSEQRIKPTSSYIHNHHLIYGLHNTNHAVYKIISSKMLVLNLVTGVVEKEYAPEQSKSRIKRCVANDSWLVYAVEQGDNSIWCVNRITDQQKRILTYKYHFHDSIQLTLSGDALYICHLHDGEKYFQAVDLSTNEIITRTDLQVSLGDSIHFENGNFVTINPYEQTRPTFYIEDYLNPEGNPSQRASDVTASIRTRVLDE